MSTNPDLKTENPETDVPETIAFNRTVKGTPLEKYWSAIGHAEKLERQLNTARAENQLIEKLREVLYDGQTVHMWFSTGSNSAYNIEILGDCYLESKQGPSLKDTLQDILQRYKAWTNPDT